MGKAEKGGGAHDVHYNKLRSLVLVFFLLIVIQSNLNCPHRLPSLNKYLAAATHCLAQSFCTVTALCYFST